MTLRLITCVGVVGAVFGLSMSPVMSADSSKVIRGSCRLIVAGVTYVDIKSDCQIWLANDGTGTLWINTDRVSKLPEYYAELTPNGDGTAAAHWNGDPYAGHAQTLLGEDLRLGRNGCWSNTTSTLCASK